MLKFIKNDAVKFIDPVSKLIPILKAEGWKIEGENDRDSLVKEANKLGLSFHHRLGDDKLKAKIEKAKLVMSENSGDNT